MAQIRKVAERLDLFHPPSLAGEEGEEQHDSAALALIPKFLIVLGFESEARGSRRKTTVTSASPTAKQERQTPKQIQCFIPPAHR